MTADANRTAPDTEDGAGSEKARSFAMLLDAVDFPGPGWVVVEERSWPTGQLDSESGKSRRALELGAVTAWRSLDQQGHRSAAWVEVVPYASAADARESLRQVPRFFTGPGYPDETVLTEHEVGDQPVPGHLEAWRFEKSMVGPAGYRWSRYTGVTVDRILVLTCCTRWGSAWPWTGVTELAAKQAQRVVARLTGSTAGSSPVHGRGAAAR